MFNKSMMIVLLAPIAQLHCFGNDDKEKKRVVIPLAIHCTIEATNGNGDLQFKPTFNPQELFALKWTRIVANDCNRVYNHAAGFNEPATLTYVECDDNYIATNFHDTCNANKNSS